MLPPARAHSSGSTLARLRGSALAVAPWALALSTAGAALGCGGSPGAGADTAPTSPLAKPPHGYAVLARAASLDAAWPLAQEVYASPRLRPTLSEAQARVFAGAPTPAKPPALVDLADTREAITDDGPTARRLLASLAKEYGLEGVFVVAPGAEGERPVVKVFVAGEGSAPAGRFAPIELRAEPGERPWASARASLERLVPAPAPGTAPAAARPAAARAATPKTEGSSAFYQSPWFWGAAGAAVVLGGAFFLATRDSSSDSIHLEMQVPR